MRRFATYSLIAASHLALISGAVQAAERATNIRVSPLGLLTGTLGGEIDIGINENVTAGPTASLLSVRVGDTALTAFSFGVRTNFYLSGPRFNDGWFVGPSALYAPMTISFDGASGSANAFAVGAVAGYQWVWESGFNINLAGGAAYYASDAEITLDDGTSVAIPLSGTVPAIEFTVGWAF